MNNQHKLIQLLLAAAVCVFPSFLTGEETDVASISATVASEPAIVETIDQSSNQETATDTAKLADKTEPFLGTSIAELNSQLSHIIKTAISLLQLEDETLAVVAATTENRHTRRSCEFILRENSLQYLNAVSAMAIFPELLGISSQIQLSKAEELLSIFPAELNHQKANRLEVLAEIETALIEHHKLTELMQRISESITTFLTESEARNKNIFTNDEIATKIKQDVKKLRQTVILLNSHFNALINQSRYFSSLSKKTIEYIKAINSEVSGTQAGVQFIKTVGGCRDLMITCAKYQLDLARAIEDLAKQSRTRKQNIENLAGNNRNYLSEPFPQRDCSLTPETVFSARQYLEPAVAILKKIAPSPSSPADKLEPTEADQQNSPVRIFFDHLQNHLDLKKDTIKEKSKDLQPETNKNPD
jgi:archaellum component FlaC